MSLTKYKELSDQVNQINNMNEVAIAFLGYINVCDTNNLISVLKQERNLIGKVLELLDEIQNEKINPGVKPRQNSAEEESSEQSATFTGKAMSLGSF